MADTAEFEPVGKVKYMQWTPTGVSPNPRYFEYPGFFPRMALDSLGFKHASIESVMACYLSGSIQVVVLTIWRSTQV